MPVITSFMHFYKYRPYKSSFGGSFGVGLPIFNTTGEGGGQSISFFLGPSLILGGSQRLAFTAGIMGGKVSVLSNGYDEGDVLENPFGGVPTESRYRLGAFVGLSMNVVGN